MSMTPPRSVEEWAVSLCEFHSRYPMDSVECGYCQSFRKALTTYAAEQVAQARGEEREACARLCEGDDINENPDTWGWHKKDYARAIRART